MNQPSIRFIGFENKWDEVCLNDIINPSGIKNTDNLPLESYSISNEKGFMPQSEKFENGGTMKNANKSMYYIVSPKSFAYNPARINVGSIGYYEQNKDIIISSLYVVFKIDDKTCDGQFFFQWFKSDKFKRLVELYQEGGVRLYFFYDKLCKCRIIKPFIAEQQQIASYFKSLDGFIQETIKKISALKQLKSASLQSMFLQAGETKPRVRFKGFEGEWKSSKASEIFMTCDERNRPDLPVLSACQDIRGMAPRSISGYDISHDKSNEVTYKRVIPGQFVIHLRSFQGGFAHSSVEGITSPAYTVFGFKNFQLHNDYYWKYVFMSKDFIERLKAITYGIRDGRSISFKEFADMQYIFPSCDEQQRIANFFRSLDTQISLETERLEKLKHIKSVCLDKMFV